MVEKNTETKRRKLAANRTRAKSMRQQPVAMEKLFWSFVRNRKLDGYKFKRQYLVGRYIVDFVCPEEKLIIELDGPFHARRKSYDEERDMFLRSRGFRVIRLTNDDFADDAAVALAMVVYALRTGDDL